MISLATKPAKPQAKSVGMAPRNREELRRCIDGIVEVGVLQSKRLRLQQRIDVMYMMLTDDKMESHWQTIEGVIDNLEEKLAGINKEITRSANW